ncbi:MAG TPA: hypothetical protein VD926_03055, partial [Acidimicrobiales bacterium]|nr:hypothetical protein [Acidimicrobiales bacterium]
MRRAKTAVLVALLVAGTLSSVMATAPAPRVASNTPSGAWATNGTVWDLVRIGDVVYLGGEFTALVSPDGTQTQPRSNLAAVSATTGQPLAWAPATNGAVLSLESSADGTRVFVGGHYTVIGGVERRRLASVRTSDGTVDTTFRADAGGRVRTLLRVGGVLFAGGEFLNIGGTTQHQVTRLDARTGAVTPGWDPVVTGGPVRALTLSPDGSRLYLGGSFTSVDQGLRTQYLAAITPATGALFTWRAGLDHTVYDVVATGSSVYVAVGGPGVPNNRLAVHDAVTGVERRRFVGDGDAQALELYGTTLYAGGHWRTDFGALPRTMLVAIDTRDDHVLDVAPRIQGMDGVWGVLAGPEGVWIAGEFTTVGGQARRGLAFLPEASPQPAETRVMVDRPGTWRYRSTLPPAGWTARTFDDSTWAAGRAEIGFGDGDEVTPIASTRQLFLRRAFSVADRGAWRALRVRVLGADGAVVHLNGIEVARDNVPAGPVTADTRALSPKGAELERTYVEFAVPSSLLLTGSNTLAVSVHAAPGSGDMSFALELLGEPGVAPPTTTELVGANQSWRVRSNGVTPASNWAGRSYDASAGGWGWGRGIMGAGNGNETTVINRTSPAHVTDWFRAWFPVTLPGRYRTVTLRLLADDGAVVYVNGTPVVRDNLPTGTIWSTTRASSARCC